MPADDARNCLTVLSVSGSDQDHLFLGHIFSHSNWVLITARSLREARRILDSKTFPVVICEQELPDGDWKDLFAAMAGQEDSPVLVVSSRTADDRLWAEVLNLGGCDVLAKPFEAKEVVWTVRMAWNDWSSRAHQDQAMTA